MQHLRRLFCAIAVSASCCVGVFIPNDVMSLRKINATQSEWLASICGRSTEFERGGRRYPWAVSVVHSRVGNFGNFRKIVFEMSVIDTVVYICYCINQGQNRLGGTIISPHHILTAAHGFTQFFFLTDGGLTGWTARPGERCQFNGFRRVESRLVAHGDDCIRIHTVRDFQETLRAEAVWRYRHKKQKLSLNGVNRTIGIRNDVCNETNIQINRIRAIYVDDGFATGGCINGHDWAVLELAEEIRFTSPAVRPICLPSAANELERDLARDPRLMIVGWGKPNAFAEGSPRLREIPMLHDPLCLAPWSDAMPTNVADYICAKAQNIHDDMSPRTCHGDSGAGLEVRDTSGRAYLLGITSFGSKMCPSNELARFTRVADYLQPICALTGVCYSATAV